MRRSVVLALAAAIVLQGCGTASGEGESYPAALRWNDEMYLLTEPAVGTTVRGPRLGEVSEIVRSLPERNGQSNVGSAGNGIYEVGELPENGESMLLLLRSAADCRFAVKEIKARIVDGTAYV
ncbi:hypothetical protein MO973_04830 [Paenibacillus sp. TRM 82003]|nr:hypothetical protein [Paenibacillus sp. TRM 82003]